MFYIDNKLVTMFTIRAFYFEERINLFGDIKNKYILRTIENKCAVPYEAEASLKHINFITM